MCLVAKTIKNNLRTIDVIVRFGGDEFGILLAELINGMYYAHKEMMVRNHNLSQII